MDDLNKPLTPEDLVKQIAGLVGRVRALGLTIPNTTNFNSLELPEKRDALEELLAAKKNTDTEKGDLNEEGLNREEENSEEEVPGDPEIQKTREVILKVLDDFDKEVKDYIDGFEISIGSAGEVPNKIEINRNERTIGIEAGLSYDEIKQVFLDFYSKRAEDPQVPTEPDFQSEGESAENPFDLSQIDPEILEALKLKNISLGTKSAQASPVIYREDEQKIYILNGADVESVNNIIRHTILNEMSGESEPDPKSDEKVVDQAEAKKSFEKKFEYEGIKITIYDHVYNDATFQQLEQIKEEIYGAINDLKPDKDNPTNLLIGLKEKYPGFNIDVANFNFPKFINFSDNTKTLTVSLEDIGEDIRDFIKKELLNISFEIGDEVLIESIDGYKSKGKVSSFYWSSNQKHYLVEVLKNNTKELVVPEKLSSVGGQSPDEKVVNPADVSPPASKAADQGAPAVEKFEGKDGVELKVGDMVEWLAYGGEIKSGQIKEFIVRSNSKAPYALVSVIDDGGMIGQTILLSRLSIAKNDSNTGPVTVPPPPPPPAAATPKPPEDTSSKIQFAEGKNKERLSINDKVSWVLSSGALNTGEIQSFSQDSFGIVAHIRPDSDPSTEVDLLAVELSLINGKDIPKSGSQVPPAASTPLKKVEVAVKSDAQYLREKFLTGEEINRLSDLRTRIFKLEKSGKFTEEDGTTLSTLQLELNKYLDELIKPADPQINSLSERVKSHFQANGVDDADRIETSSKKIIFEITVRGEQEERMKLLKASREESKWGRAGEALRSVVGTKALSWYLKQSRVKRFAINAALIGAAVGGATFFSTGSVGMALGGVALRTARAGASFVGGNAGALGGEWLGKKVTGISGVASNIDKQKEEAIKKTKSDNSINEAEKNKQIKQAEDIANERKKNLWDEWYKQEVEKIWKTAGSREEMSKALANLEKSYKNKTRIVTGATILGALAGGLSGALAADMTAPAKPNNSGVERGNVDTTRAQTPPASGASNNHAAGAASSGSTSARGTGGPAPDLAKTAPKIENIPGISAEKAQFVPEKGDTLWGGVGKILENNPKYNGLSPEGKEFMQSTYLNKIIDNKENLGLEADTDYGVKLKIGQKIDLSKVFKDDDEFNKLIEKAKNLSEKQKLNIQKNDKLIADWVKSHPGQKASISELNKLLSGDYEKPSAGAKEFTPPSSVGESLNKGAKIYYDYDAGPQVDYSGNKVGSKALDEMSSDFDNVKKSIDDLANQQEGISEKISNIKSPVVNDPTQVNIPQPENWSQKIIDIKEDLNKLYEQGRDLNSRLIKAMTPKDGTPAVPKGEIDRISSELSDIESKTKALEDEVQRIIKDANAAEENILNKAPDDMASMGSSAAGLAAFGKVVTDMKKDPAVLAKEIEEAKRRLQVLEGGRKDDRTDNNMSGGLGGLNRGGLRTMARDTRDHEREIIENNTKVRNVAEGRMGTSSEEASEDVAEAALRSGVDSIFGKTGFLGIGKVSGIKSEAWQTIQRLPYEYVLEYFKKGSSEFLIDPKQTKELGNSKNTPKYLNLMKEIVGLERKLADMGKGEAVQALLESGSRKITVKEYLKSLIGLVTAESSESEAGLKRAA